MKQRRESPKLPQTTGPLWRLLSGRPTPGCQIQAFQLTLEAPWEIIWTLVHVCRNTRKTCMGATQVKLRANDVSKTIRAQQQTMLLNCTRRRHEYWHSTTRKQGPGTAGADISNIKLQRLFPIHSHMLSTKRVSPAAGNSLNCSQPCSPPGSPFPG